MLLSSCHGDRLVRFEDPKTEITPTKFYFYFAGQDTI